MKQRALGCLILLCAVFLLEAPALAQGIGGWEVNASGVFLEPVGALTDRFNSTSSGILRIGQKTDDNWLWEGRIDAFRFKSDKSFPVRNKNKDTLSYQPVNLQLEAYGIGIQGSYYFLSFGSIEPRLTFGAGIYRWSGTRGAFADSTVKIPESTQQDWSGGFNAGIGVDWSIIPRLAFTLDAQYQIIMGELWPTLAEPLKLENISSFQMFSAQVGIRFYF
jgi:hypothetical protein